MIKFYLNTREIAAISEIMTAMDVDCISLVYNNGSGIGHTLDVEFDYDVKGYTALVSIPITTVEDW